MHSNPPAPEVTVREYTQDILRFHAAAGTRYKRALMISGILFLIGVLGFIVRAVGDGFDERQPWGYFAATVAYIMSTAVAAPIVVVAMRMVKNHWGRPFARIAEMYSVVGVLMLLMFIPLLFLVPSALNRRTLWFQSDTVGSVGEIPGAPHFWVALVLVLLVVCSLAMLWLSSRPDMAVLRDHGSGMARSWGKRLSRGWLGTRKQWRIMRGGLGILGGFFFLILIGAHTLFSIDFDMALVPGWKDAIYPAFEAMAAIQGGLATVVLTLYLLRRYGGLERYVHMEHFWGVSKILLAASLLWFYFWFSGFIVYWYGRQPVEQNVLKLLMFGPYQAVFYLAFILSFVAPAFTLIWNGVRRSVWGPPLASLFILVGGLMEKVRLYVSAYSVPVDQINDHILEAIPATHLPDVFDLMMMAGGVSGAVFMVLLTARVIPMISLWEMAEGIRLRAVRPFLRREITVLAKPE